MAQSKRHHVVSQGLQRGWANGVGRVELITKASGESVPTAVENSLLKSYFNSVLAEEGDHDDRLEKEWSRLEGEAFPVLAAFLDNEREFDARVDQEIKVLLAMHVARSFSTRLLHDRILDTFGPGFVDQMLEDPRLVEGWIQQYGYPPTREALETMVDEILVLHGEVNDLYIPRQVSVYNSSSRHTRSATSNSWLRGPIGSRSSSVTFRRCRGRASGSGSTTESVPSRLRRFGCL